MSSVRSRQGDREPSSGARRRAAPLLLDGVGDRRRGDQPPGVLVRRVGHDLESRSLLDDPSCAHHDDAVAELVDHGQIVTDEQAGEMEVALKGAQQIQHRLLDRHVQRRRRLVSDEQKRSQRDGSGDGHALPLAARQLVRVAGAPGCGQLDPLSRSSATLARRSRPRECTTSGSAIASPTVRRGSSAATEFWNTTPIERRMSRAVRPRAVARSAPWMRMLPCRGRHEAQRAASDRRLPRAGLSDQPDELTLADAETRHPRRPAGRARRVRRRRSGNRRPARAPRDRRSLVDRAIPSAGRHPGARVCRRPAASGRGMRHRRIPRPCPVASRSRDRRCPPRLPYRV